ncbi:MAG: adenylate/guanylate cyclase domain-containing protein [Actinomycetota bacterium]|nr:adenylate/guanylate cyclase domain-containing protein [Actinomycetota bacterium]
MTAARSARIELLERLLDEGATLGELRRAVRDGRLALLPVERALSNDVRIGSAELARLRGLDLAFVLSVRRALGLPDADPEEPVFREADVETFRELGNVRREARLADDGMLEVLGVVGRSLWKISETTLAVVDEAVSGSSVNECDLAMRYAQVALQLGTVAGPLLESAMHAHLREGLREEVVTTEELRSGIDDTWTVTVCFVDLVGFTGLGEQLTAEGAHALARGLTRIAASVASPPVRLVKMMGDGAMLVSTEARPLIDAALEMVARGAEDGRLPPLRAGISHGEAFARGGDWYGATVNLASRVMEIAEPGTILATRGARDAALDGYAWSPAGRERLRGITDEVELFRVASSSPP